jgi:hypothetical protein
MKTLVLVLVLCALAAGFVHAADPLLFSPAVGGHNYVPGGRDICWSEPADLNDAKISSEIIGAYGLESEVANDFMVPDDTLIDVAYGYGGYYNWVPGDPPITSLNWKFYDDAGCVPNTLLNTFTGLGTEIFIGYDAYGWPTYKYVLNVAQTVNGGELYWFSLQAADHPYPPQWGRQGTGGIVTNCDTMFKSAFFSYPNWTPAGDLGPWDAAQEFECQPEIPTPTQETSWGAVRELFR